MGFKSDKQRKAVMALLGVGALGAGFALGRSTRLRVIGRNLRDPLYHQYQQRKAVSKLVKAMNKYKGTQMFVKRGSRNLSGSDYGIL